MRYILQKSPIKNEKWRATTASQQLNLLNIGTAQVLTVPKGNVTNIGYYVKGI